MDSQLVQTESPPMNANPLRRAADKMNDTVLATFAFLAAHGANISGLERYWADVRAEANPIKEIAVGFVLISVALVIALTMLPVVTSAVNTAATDGNITATDAVLLRLLPTLLIVGLIAGGVAFLFRGFKAIKS